MICAIDPGTYQSGIVMYQPETHAVVESEVVENEQLYVRLQRYHTSMRLHYVIEMVSSYGLPVGASTFETVLWIGRFDAVVGRQASLIERQEVKTYFCGQTARVKDGHIRRAALNRFPETGGGAEPQVGTKRNPGPLYGVASHCWQALALAILFSHKAGFTDGKGNCVSTTTGEVRDE